VIPGIVASSISTTPPTPTDPFFASVLYGTHADGVNLSTTITDIKGKTTTSTGTYLSDVQKKFGPTSIRFDGASYMRIADGGSFSFAGDFTIEFQAYGSVSGPCLFWANSNYLYNNTLSVAGGGAITGLAFDNSLVFRHLAIERSGNTIRVYENGIIKGSLVYTGTFNFAQPVFGRYEPNVNLYYTGYIDELRVTAAARYGGVAFTPPTQPFPNS
jgi:hypothetical protein